MSRRSRLENSGISLSESPISRPLNQRQTVRLLNKFQTPLAINPLLFSRARSRSRPAENCIGRDILDCTSEPELEETSPTFPRFASSLYPNRSPSVLPCRTPSSSSSSGRSTPVNTPSSTINLRESCCDHERQFDALQRNLAALTEKIDNLQGLSTTVVAQRRSENLPRDMVVSI